MSSEQVADQAVDAARCAIWRTDAPVGAYLADQLLVKPGPGRGRRVPDAASVTSHAVTNIEVVKRFLDVDVKVIKETSTHRIEVRSRGD